MHFVIFKAIAELRENLSALWFPTRSIKNLVVQPQKTSRAMKYQIYEGREVYYVTYKLCGFLKARFIKMEHECINKTKNPMCAQRRLRPALKPCVYSSSMQWHDACQSLVAHSIKNDKKTFRFPIIKNSF